MRGDGGIYEDHIWEGMAAERRVLTRRSAAGANGVGVALRSAVALRAVWRVLASLLAAAAALWQPPAAKEGQGDCDFPLGPPWILLYPLKRRRSAEGLEAAGRCAFAWRSAVVAKDWVGGVALRSSVALRHSRCVLAPHLAAAAALWQPPAAKEGQGDCDFPLGPPWSLLLPLETPPLR